jgi:hypothetical protein
LFPQTLEWALYTGEDKKGKNSECMSGWQYALNIKVWEVEGVEDFLSGHMYRYSTCTGGCLAVYTASAPTEIQPFVLTFPAFAYFVKEVWTLSVSHNYVTLTLTLRYLKINSSMWQLFIGRRRKIISILKSRSLGEYLGI